MISKYFILLICLHYVTFALSQFLSVKDKMYVDFAANNPCVLRLNGTNQFGCTSSRFGNVGTLHLVKNLTDIDWLLNEGLADPYIVALTPIMFTSVLRKIEWNKSKINGVLLLMNGTNQEVIDTDNLFKTGFSPEDSCPNRYSGISSCNSSQPWNSYGTDILLKNWDFPIFVVHNKSDIKEIVDCFENHNLPLSNQNDHSLCTLELKAHMYAAVDSKTCVRRTMMTQQNMRPIKFCDPLGDKNVYWSLKELQPNTTNKSVAIIAARLDAASMFQDLTPGALSTATSIVTLMTTANLISEMLPYDDAKNHLNNIMFVLFNGEAYDYIGSSRMVYDMLQGSFPNEIINFNKEHIGLFVELSQIHYEKEVVFHNPSTDNTNENIKTFIKIFKDSLTKLTNDFTIYESKNKLIPPASIHSFLKKDPLFPGLVLTGFEEKFKNRFYHSILDDAYNVQYDDRSINLALTIANISTSLSYSIYNFITNTNYIGTKEANASYVSKLLDCYIKSINCEVFQSLTSPLKLPDSPPNYYISIDLITNPLTSLSRLLFASFGSKKINDVNNEENCLQYQTQMGFTPIWLKGNYSACYSTTSNITDAVSPAFIIPDYDLSSPEFSTWTESIWHEVDIRMFLKQSLRLQFIIFITGVSVFLFSFIITKKIFAQSEIYFNNQEANSVTHC